jgi:hypothetical protein
MKVDFSFFLGILQELQSISNGDLMMKTLEHLYQTLRNTKPGSIHTGDRYSFMLDDNLN